MDGVAGATVHCSLVDVPPVEPFALYLFCGR
jgi:hypothetical protein